jgi:hypothetical protein
VRPVRGPTPVERLAPAVDSCMTCQPTPPARRGRQSRAP